MALQIISHAVLLGTFYGMLVHIIIISTKKKTST